MDGVQLAVSMFLFLWVMGAAWKKNKKLVCVLVLAFCLLTQYSYYNGHIIMFTVNGSRQLFLRGVGGGELFSPSLAELPPHVTP